MGLQYHGRSISLPSRLNPHCTKIEVEINKLKSWENSLASMNVPLSSYTIQTGLVGLADLYNCVEEFVLSPLTQQALRQPRNGEVIMEEALEWSIGLLDLCGVSREIFLIMKEHVQDLQSVLRRKGGDSSIESNINAYMSFRKKMKKDVSKCLRKLKHMESKFESYCSLELDHDHLSMVTRVLREVKSIAISVFRSLLLFLSVPASKTRPCGWSILISKLMLARSELASEKDQKILNEVGSVDFALYSILECIKSNNAKIDVHIARRRLETLLDDTIDNFESGLDCLYRSLIRHRVSLLNIVAY